MTLYRVEFTTKREITVYSGDKKRTVVDVKTMDTPVVMRNLPQATAMQYANCDNFAMTAETRDVTQDKNKGYRKREYTGEASYSSRTAPASRPGKPTYSSPKAKPNAAATGDMSAAING